MLSRAAERLRKRTGSVPPNIVLLQADLLDLPFRPASFQTVLSMGMLHLFDDVEPILALLDDLVVPEGDLLVTSLVENGRIGDHYLRFLHRSGEVARPRSAAEFTRTATSVLDPGASISLTGNMAYVIS
jgi:ubiquinone/menaquinone biosynthesis C-methylase UbiE